MAKLQQLQRILVIIRKLNSYRRYVPANELQDYVRKDMEIRGGDSGYSLRTIQRDIKMIEELFGIIICHKQGLGYFIDCTEMASPDKYEELLKNLDVLAALDADTGLHDYVITEHHRAAGSELMPYLLNAIRNSHPVEFDYTLIRYDDKSSHRIVAPYFLKENQQRWYLIGKDEGRIKVFGLDRINNLMIKNENKFQKDDTLDHQKLFMDSFGIWNDPEIPVEDIVLSYSPLDGRFLKTLPLHHSQEILVDSPEEFRIRVRLRITNDFVMELLSHCSSLTVLEPFSLRQRIKNIYEGALRRNMNE